MTLPAQVVDFFGSSAYLSAMNRIDRVTAILIQLQSRKIVKAQDIAERFGISLRTVYRDINTLGEAGIPIIGEAGQGYSIMDGYRLPPVMFTREEATAFLTAEKLVEKLTDTATMDSYKSAMYKVRSVLRSTEKDMLENMEDHIAVFHNYAPFSSDSVNDVLQVLLKGISDRRAVHICYTAANTQETTERLIEPVGIFYAHSHWYTIAFCHLRSDYRDFRADRMLKAKNTDTPFDKKHQPFKKYLEEKNEKPKDLTTIVLDVDKELAPYLQNQKYYYGFFSEEQKGDKIRMTFLSRTSEYFIRWYAMFADRAVIVSPADLKHALKEYLKKVAQNL